MSILKSTNQTVRLKNYFSKSSLSPTYHGFTPKAAPVLQSENTATRFITHTALRTNRQVSLQPLMRHRDLRDGQTDIVIACNEPVFSIVYPHTLTHPILILDDVLPDGRKCRPFAVIRGSDRTAFMSLKLTHCKQYTHVKHLC